MTMYNEAYGAPWSGNQPPHRWFSPDCYAGINMADRHQRGEDFSLWPPVQTGSPVTDAHSSMSTAVAADLFKWKTSNHGHVTPDFSNLTSDALNNNLIHHAVRHESTSSTGSYRSNGASSVNSPMTPHNGNNNGAPLVIPQPVKPALNKGTNKTYQCKMCDQIFSTKSDMLIHSQQVHKQDMKPYSVSAFRCPQCQKCFANSSYLSQHNRIHAGIKPYKCEICDRKFTQLSHLQQHIRTHTGEKPYKCHHSGCGKAFSQLSNLQSHSRSHMTDKPYRCNSCYKCYSDEIGLREHIPKHSETKHIKTQICKICGKAYTQETYLARHMLKHTNENVKLSQQQKSVKQEPSEHSNLEAVDFTRILERVERAQDNSTPGLKSPGSSVSSAFMPLPQFGVSSSNSSAYPYGPGLNSGLTSGLSTNNLSSSLPHISSMSSPRYFPYDPIGFRKSSEPMDRYVNDRLVNDRLVNDRLVNDRLVNDRLVNDRLVNDRLVNDRLVNDRLVNDRLMNDRLVNERLERNINVPHTTRPENMLANSFLSLQHIKNYASQQMPPSFSPCSSGTSRLT